jgi:hypothetical protein
MISTGTTEQILHILPSDMLAKDMLVAASRREETDANLGHLSKALGLSALLRMVAGAPGKRGWSAACLRGRRLGLCETSGAQIVEPVVLGDGSILATIEPSGKLVVLREGEDSPLPVEVAPFPVRAKAMRDGICHLLEREGSRICMVDKDLRLVGVSDALTEAGVEHPTSLCFYGDFIGLLSWPLKEAWILDADWRPVVKARLPWVDFLTRPVGVGDTLVAVDTPSCSHGPGGLVGVVPDGRPFSLFDALAAPLGLAACGDLLACGHCEGLSLFKLAGARAVPLGDTHVRSLCGPLDDDERVALTYIVRDNDSFLLFCDVLVAGVSGPGVSRVVQIRVEDCLAAVGLSRQGKSEWTDA